MKDADPCSSHSRSWVVHARQKLEASSALLQPHSSSCLVNAWQKLKDLAIKISMDIYCQPWPLSLIGIIAVLFAIGLASVTAQDWDLDQKLQLALCYIIIVGSLILIRCLLWSILQTKLLHGITDPPFTIGSVAIAMTTQRCGENLFLMFSYLLWAGCFAAIWCPLL